MTGAFERLLEDVARSHGFGPKELRRKATFRHIARARNEFYWRARRLPASPSYPRIGAFIGRHHSSVMNGERKHEAQIAKDKHHDNPR